MRPSLPTRASWEPETSRYVDRREVKASYWRNGRMSPGLLRARRQFRTKNAFAGVVLLAFVVGVFSYSLAAVKQDVFDELDEEVTERAVLDAKRAALTVEDEKRAMAAAAAFATGSTIRGPKLSDRVRNAAAAASELAQEPRHDGAPQRRGVLATLLDERFPWLLDPTRKTLVWGAPPVDRIGSLGEKLKP